MTFLAKIFGTKSDREIKKILPIVNQVNQFYDTLKDKDISYLQSRTKELQVIIKKSIEEQESKKLVNIDDSKELKVLLFFIISFAPTDVANILSLGKIGFGSIR